MRWLVSDQAVAGSNLISTHHQPPFHDVSCCASLAQLEARSRVLCWGPGNKGSNEPTRACNASSFSHQTPTHSTDQLLDSSAASAPRRASLWWMSRAAGGGQPSQLLLRGPSSCHDDPINATQPPRTAAAAVLSPSTALRCLAAALLVARAAAHGGGEEGMAFDIPHTPLAEVLTWIGVVCLVLLSGAWHARSSSCGLCRWGLLF